MTNTDKLTKLEKQLQAAAEVANAAKAKEREAKRKIARAKEEMAKKKAQKVVKVLTKYFEKYGDLSDEEIVKIADKLFKDHYEEYVAAHKLWKTKNAARENSETEQQNNNENRYANHPYGNQ